MRSLTDMLHADVDPDLDLEPAIDADGYTSNDDPDHYSERYTGRSDNGGVYINSGIA